MYVLMFYIPFFLFMPQVKDQQSDSLHLILAYFIFHLFPISFGLFDYHF